MVRGNNLKWFIWSVAENSFQSIILLQNLIFRYFLLPLLMLTLEVWSRPIHFDKYLDHMMVKFDKIVRSELYNILSFLTKNG